MIRLLLLSVCLALFAQDVLNNEAIIKLVKSGMSEDLILNVIRQQPGTYALGADQLIELKNGGASEKIIAAMLAKMAGKEAPAASGAASNPAPAAKAALPTAGGPHYKKGSEWFELIDETVDWKNTGLMKNFVSAGIVKKNLKGTVSGPNSRNLLNASNDILLVTPQGVSVSEFVLVPMKSEKGKREFEVGPTNKKSGLAQGAIAFGLQKAGANQYQVILTTPLQPGEYGILLLSAIGSGTGMGQMFTFRMLQ
ncbi:MAG: hypothetical protein U0Q16_10940 [Bryobacteraceae bacterium]